MKPILSLAQGLNPLVEITLSEEEAILLENHDLVSSFTVKKNDKKVSDYGGMLGLSVKDNIEDIVHSYRTLKDDCVETAFAHHIQIPIAYYNEIIQVKKLHAVAVNSSIVEVVVQGTKSFSRPNIYDPGYIERYMVPTNLFRLN